MGEPRKGSFEYDESGDEENPFTQRRRPIPCIEESDDEEDDDSSSSEDEDDGIDNTDDAITCPICLGEFTDQLIGIPENCKHIFCVDCIREWIKNVNNCPVDRKKFNSISVHVSPNGPEIEKIPVQDAPVNIDVNEEPPTCCQVCGRYDREDTLLLCDECDNGYHMDCLTPALSTVPIDEWFCSECRTTRSEQPSTSSTSRRQRTHRRQRGREIINVEDDGEEDDDVLFIGDSRVLERLVDETIEEGRDAIARSANERLSSGKKKTSKKKKKTKSANKPKKKNSKSEKVKKAKRKLIDRELQKFRERQKGAKKQGSHDKDVKEQKRIAVYGDPFDLDEFFGDPDEDYFDNNVLEAEEDRSTICNSTDVVGSILGGFGTLNPENCLVMRDGTLKEKEQQTKSDQGEDSGNESNNDAHQIRKEEIENNTLKLENVNEGKETDKQRKRKLSSSTCNIQEIIAMNKKRRRIRFLEEEVEDDLENPATAADSNSADMCIELGSNDHSDVTSNTMKDHKRKLKLAEEKLRQGFLEKQKEKERAEELKKQVKLMLEQAKDSNDFKTQSTTPSVLKFKIPKKKRPAKDTNSERVIGNNTHKTMNMDDETSDHKSDKSTSPKVSISKQSTQQSRKLDIYTTTTSTFTSDTPMTVDLTYRKNYFPESRKEPLSLEKKLSLYNNGNLKSLQKSQTRKNSETKLTSTSEVVVATVKNPSTFTNQQPKIISKEEALSKLSTLQQTSQKSASTSKQQETRAKPHAKPTAQKPTTYSKQKTGNLLTQVHHAKNSSNNSHYTAERDPVKSILKSKQPEKCVLKVKSISTCSENPKKHISLDDYKERQFLADIFGPEDDETESKRKLEKSNHLSQPHQKHNEPKRKPEKLTPAKAKSVKFYKQDNKTPHSKDLDVSKHSSNEIDFRRNSEHIVSAVISKALRHNPNTQTSVVSNSNMIPPRAETKTTTTSTNTIMTRTFDTANLPPKDNPVSRFVMPITNMACSLSSTPSISSLSTSHFNISTSVSSTITSRSTFLPSNPSKLSTSSTRRSSLSSSSSSSIPVGVVSPQIRKHSDSKDKDVRHKRKNGEHDHTTKRCGEDEVTLSRDEYIGAVKGFLKPFYKKQKLTKDQWKEVVKQAVKTIEKNPSIFSLSGIEKLVKSLVSPIISATK